MDFDVNLLDVSYGGFWNIVKVKEIGGLGILNFWENRFVMERFWLWNLGWIYG